MFERINGLDLCSLRERLPGGVPQRHLVWIMRRVLSVLGWAHKNGILRGNVEPTHLLVRPADHNVWLVDWSWAIVEPAKTGRTFRCLNEDYGPPEARDRKAPLPSSDLHSLGKAMIYAAGGDPATNPRPDTVDLRLQRFLRFFVVESALGRAGDAWDMSQQLDNLREEVFGRHAFLALEVQITGAVSWVVESTVKTSRRRTGRQRRETRLRSKRTSRARARRRSTRRRSR